MTARAHIESDWIRDGVKIAVLLNADAGVRTYVRWPEPIVASRVEPDEAEPEDAWLPLPTDAARALYEALADHFGHSGHDTRALRRDYDAERGRVDKLIAHLTKGATA